MLDRFTDRARKVMSMAKQEALDLHSNKVDISYDDIMDTLKEVQTTVPEPSEETEAAKLAFTPLVISVMERSFRVARENNQTYVSTEHLLIGIVEEGNGMAMDILIRLHQKGYRETHRQGPGQEASARRRRCWSSRCGPAVL